MSTTKAHAAAVLALPLRATHNGLAVTCRDWSGELSVSPAVLDALANQDLEALNAARGPADTATLTSDGRRAIPSVWCGCDSQSDDWIRYERWTAEGLAAHGYVCPDCRRLKQSG